MIAYLVALISAVIGACVHGAVGFIAWGMCGFLAYVAIRRLLRFVCSSGQEKDVHWMERVGLRNSKKNKETIEVSAEMSREASDRALSILYNPIDPRLNNRSDYCRIEKVLSHPSSFARLRLVQGTAQDIKKVNALTFAIKCCRWACVATMAISYFFSWWLLVTLVVPLVMWWKCGMAKTFVNINLWGKLTTLDKAMVTDAKLRARVSELLYDDVTVLERQSQDRPTQVYRPTKAKVLEESKVVQKSKVTKKPVAVATKTPEKPKPVRQPNMMICSSCRTANEINAETCFMCGEVVG